jgi:hypothetical protein
MRETPLITFTKADDAGCGQRDPGDLDYIIHGDALSRWLSRGDIARGEDVATRAARLAEELRNMADALVSDEYPVSVSLEHARAMYAARVVEFMKASYAAPIGREP